MSRRWDNGRLKREGRAERCPSLLGLTPGTGLGGGNVSEGRLVNADRWAAQCDAACAALAAPGTLTPETLVWRHGMTGWTPAGQVPELAALFTARR